MALGQNLYFGACFILPQDGSILSRASYCIMQQLALLRMLPLIINLYCQSVCICRMVSLHVPFHSCVYASSPSLRLVLRTTLWLDFILHSSIESRLLRPIRRAVLKAQPCSQTCLCVCVSSTKNCIHHVQNLFRHSLYSSHCSSFLLNRQTSRRQGLLVSDACYRQDLPKAGLPVLFLLTCRLWSFSPRRGDTLNRSS